MISFRRSSRKKVQIDVDWLLGPAPTAPIVSEPAHALKARHRRTSKGEVASASKLPGDGPSAKALTRKRSRWGGFFFVASLLGVGGAVAFHWDTVSKQLLCWEWNRLLQLPETNEETLEAIVALSETAHDSNRILVTQLGQADATRRAIAFQILKDRIDRLPANPSSNAQRIALCQLLQSLSADDRELVMMRGVLASRLLSGFGEEVRGDAPVRQTLNQWIAASSIADPLLTAQSNGSAPAKIRLSGDDETPLVSAPMVAAPLASWNANGLRRTEENQPPVPSLPKATWIGDGNSNESSRADIVQSSTRASSRPTRGDGGSSRRLSDASGPEPLRMASAQQSSSPRLEQPKVGLDARKQKGANGSLIDLAMDSEDSVDARLTATKAVVEVAPNPLASEEEFEEPTLRGIRKLPQDKLLRLLESRQDRLVTQAAQELQRRGVQPEHLELGLELARGSVTERLQAMDQLVRVAGLNPVPWLVWMAESSDREVRLRAVSLLGATADEEALQKLRQLKKKESDNRVAEQINQVLLAADSARSTNR